MLATTVSRRVFVLGGHTTEFIGRGSPRFIDKSHPDFGKKENPNIEVIVLPNKHILHPPRYSLSIYSFWWRNFHLEWIPPRSIRYRTTTLYNSFFFPGIGWYYDLQYYIKEASNQALFKTKGNFMVLFNWNEYIYTYLYLIQWSLSL